MLIVYTLLLIWAFESRKMVVNHSKKFKKYTGYVE